jgi:hypothetical protein
MWTTSGHLNLEQISLRGFVYGFGSVLHAELGEQMVRIALHGSFCDAEPAGDL